MPNSQQQKNDRLQGYVDKALFGLFAILIGWQQLQANATRDDIKQLDTRVLYLYTNTVSKSELKDTEERITRNVEAIRSDIKGLLQMYIGDMVRADKR